MSWCLVVSSTDNYSIVSLINWLTKALIVLIPVGIAYLWQSFKVTFFDIIYLEQNICIQWKFHNT